MAERQLPESGINLQYETIEELLLENYDDFTATIDEGVMDMPDGSVFIDGALEMEFPNAFQYTDAISDLLAGERACEESRLAAYRAFHFANTVSTLLMSSPTKMYTADFYGEESPEELLNKMRFFAGDYLSDRKTLDNVIGRYMSEIDPSGKFGDVAEVVAALTFMFIDSHEHLRAIDLEVAAFQIELEAFAEPEV